MASETSAPDEESYRDFVSVPREPTLEMSAAGMRCIKNIQVDHFHKYAAGIANSIFEEMINAADGVNPAPAREK